VAPALQPLCNVLIVNSTSHHAYTCLRKSSGPERKSQRCLQMTQSRIKIVDQANSLEMLMPPLHLASAATAVILASKWGAKYILKMPPKIDTRTLRNSCKFFCCEDAGTGQRGVLCVHGVKTNREHNIGFVFCD
jgi:hypothetical protein